jgi:DNA-binding response OmpR family regulator
MARIIVAEDDRHISRVLSLWITRNGHEVLQADDGEQALDRIRETRPDLLVTDVNMPILDGMQLLQVVRDEELIPHPAIILTSRCDQKEIAAQAKQLGAVVHPKPFSPQHLMEEIESSLNTPWERSPEFSETGGVHE